MRKKLNNILLIDDDEDYNYINRRFLVKMDCVENIHSARDGKEALAYLKTQVKGKYPSPEIIFLDLYMPGMGGWNFLEEYNKLKDHVKAKTVIVTTVSLSTKDYERALNEYSVGGFYNKPITEDHLMEILHKHFPELMGIKIKADPYKVMEFLGKAWKYFFN